MNGIDLCGDTIYLTDGEEVGENSIEATPRIGVDYAEEYKDMNWRFFLRGNEFVSRFTKSDR